MEPGAVGRLIDALREERATKAAELEAIDAALRGLDVLAKQYGAITRVYTPESTTAPRQARRIDPAVLAQAKRRYEVDGQMPGEIAVALGLTKQAVQYHARQWKKPPRQPELMPGRVRCPACGEWTQHDPCVACGKAVRP